MPFAIAVGTDLVAIVILAYVLYFRRHRRRDLLLSYVALNIGVVAVTSALGSVEVGVGLGMGLFGILSIIRLRSDQITQQEIAYYFTALALGLLAGLHPEPMWLTPVLSALVILAIAILDSPLIASSTVRSPTVTRSSPIWPRCSPPTPSVSRSSTSTWSATPPSSTSATRRCPAVGPTPPRTRGPAAAPPPTTPPESSTPRSDDDAG